jgi:sirohydrochlorin ferrochelatase
MPDESRIPYGSVTDPSEAAGPLPRREPLPRRGDLPPQHGDPPPQHESLSRVRDSLARLDDEEPATQPGAPLPPPEPPSRREDSLPHGAEPFPQRGGSIFQPGEPLPRRGGESVFQPREPLPQREPPSPRGESVFQPREPLPRRGEPLPQREPLPQPGEALPQRGEALPQRGEALPQRGEALPQRGEALPRRTGRTRRSGRHRSPDRLSLPSDAPTLLIAVPGTARPGSETIGEQVAAAARVSCQGADVQVAFLEGTEHRLDEALAALADGPWPALAVVVPLLAGPHPRSDLALQRVVAGADGQVVVAEHLGPHPLLAEALHSRLAEVGLARESRVRGLSISTVANGVLVLADRGDDAVRAAGVAAVLLAGRLAAPAVHASIDDPQGIASAAERLQAMGASRVAIAPCVIGPETDPRELDAVSAAIGALAAPPLGAHPAIGQLVAMRYGNALVGLRPAGTMG